MPHPLRLAFPAITAALLLLTSACSSIPVRPGDGAESVFVNTLDYPELFDVEYIRAPGEGPAVVEGNTWTYFYSLPVNRVEIDAWVHGEFPRGTLVANLRGEVWTPWYGYFLMIPSLGMVRVDRVRFEFDPVRLIPPPGEGP